MVDARSLWRGESQTEARTTAANVVLSSGMDHIAIVQAVAVLRFESFESKQLDDRKTIENGR